MFDICICKCKKFIDCHCKVKVHIRERYFLLDQRTVRKMAIGNADKKGTQLVHNNMNRKAIQSSRPVGKSKQIISFQFKCKIKIEKATSFENSDYVSEELFGIKTSEHIIRVLLYFYF